MQNYKSIYEDKLQLSYDYQLMDSSKQIEFAGGYFNPTDFIKYNLIENNDINEVVSIDCDEKITSNDKWDYLCSVSSGIIAAALDIFYVKTFSLSDAAKWGKKQTDDFIISFAKLQGYKGENLNDAIKTLENKFHLPSDKVTNDFGGARQHHLRDFAHHASIAGLVFSILGQFTHKAFGTDTMGNFLIVDIPDSAFTAKNTEEKIFNGTIIWLFHLISDMDGSSGASNGGTGIPGLFLSTLKELSVLPIIKDIKVKYKNDDIGLSVFISKLFNGTYFPHNNHKDVIKFDLRTEIGVINQITKQAMPIIINECIVRCIFALRRFYYEIQRNDIRTLNDLSKINYINFLPFRNDDLNRMLTIATGTFTAIDLSHATVCSIILGKDDKEYAKHFLVRVNIVGVGRFVLACKSELDIYKRKISVTNTSDSLINNLSKVALRDPVQEQILFSLFYLKCKIDINHTKNKYKKDVKEAWLNKWVESITKQLRKNDDFIIKKSNVLKNTIKNELNKTENKTWMYLISLELSLFYPYTPLGSKDIDSKLKGIKLNIKNIDDEFASLQSFVGLKEIKNIIKLYNSYHDKLTGKTTKTIGATLGIVTITAATAGIGIYFAPQIAVGLLGSSAAFSGLHGAALTSATLAAFGGGALAAGGLGMAGGTAIIGGGGAIIALTSSAITASTINSFLSDSNNTKYECCKLLTFSKYVLIDKMHEYTMISELSKQLSNTVESYEKVLALSDNKKKNKNIKKSLSYLRKTIDVLSKESKKS